MLDYKVIDLNTYPRRAHLEYFMTLQCPQLAITADVDVTELLKFCKTEGYPFFLSFLHVVALSADAIPQLRQRIHRLPEGGFEVREYTQSPTSHTESTGGELYCYCSVYHHMPWEEYIKQAMENQRLAREKGSLEEDEEIEGFYFPTCLPWLHYNGMTHPMTDSFDSNPRFSWGKYEEDFKGRMMMPLTAAVHHGLVDGLQLGKFYENVQKNIAALVRGELDYNLPK